MEKYQTFWRRAGATILDSIFIMPVNWAVSIGTTLMISEPAMLFLAIPGTISAAYYILFHYYRGQTPGKMIAKVKVLDDSENPLSFGQSILRSLPQLLFPMFAISFSTADASSTDIVGMWAGVIYGFTFVFSLADVLVCLASDKRRALHDFIAGTIVVRTDV